MKLVSQTKVITIEEPDRLQFVLERELGLADLLVGPIVVGCVAAYALYAHSWWPLLFCVLAFGAFLANYLNGPVTTITVSDRGIEAIGNLGRAFKTHVVVQASQIETFSYSIGNEEENSGLYINQRELLAALNEEQANHIADKVRAKFPLLERGDHSPTSLLHGDESGISALGLAVPSASATPPTRRTIREP